MSRYLKELIGEIDARFSDDTLNMSMSEWVCANTTHKGKPFSLKGYEFQEAILDDMHPNMDVIKPSQVGLTEAQIRKALAFLVRNQGTNLIFTLPTESMFKRISKGRVKPVVDKDKVFNTPYDKEHKAVRATDMMQFGHSFLYMTPAIETAATSINADIVMNDEVDLSDQAMITLFHSRLQGSDIAISQRFSTPTFPNFGIDLNYKSSDQMEYVCQCSSCNHYNLPEFTHKFIHLPGVPENISELHKLQVEHQDLLDLESSYVKCEKCGSPLDLSNPDKREWVARYPSRSLTSRGYKVTPFVTRKLDPKYILTSLWRYQNVGFVRGFFNTTLGQAYSDGNIQLPRELIENCFTSEKYNEPEFSEFTPIWIGIDVGQTCHIVLGAGPDIEHLHIFSMMSIHVDDIISKVTELCKDYNIVGGAVDRHPYTPTSEEIQKVSGGLILPVEYRGLKELNLVYDEYHEVSHGQVNRTWFIDNFATQIRKGNIKISNYGAVQEVYIEHLRDMVRDEQPGQPATWQKLTGNDHFFHASAFMALGPKINENIKLKSKTDMRSMVDIKVTTNPSSSSNLIGMSNKRVDCGIGIGYN